nr:NADH dehydrogenase subunit 6 [Comanthus sp. 2 MS-2014]
MNIYLSIIFLLLGTSLVFYSMSPYFSALGLTIVSISSCFLLIQTGMNFLALILLLVYMGGMLIVFIYSSALSADRFPIISNTNEIITLFLFITLWTIFLFNNNNWNNINSENISNTVSIEGASYLFSSYFFLFFIFAAYILLITLIAVLNISNETESFTLRAL